MLPITANLAAQDSDISPAFCHGWNYCYLHGTAEAIMGHDCFIADAPMPTEVGMYLVTVDWQVAIAVIDYHYGILSGRVVLANDTEALQHALNEKEWR